MANFVIGTILVLVVSGIVRKLIADRKQGKNTCGCGCSNCASSEMCHPKK